MSDWTALADDATLDRVAKRLKDNGIDAIIVNTKNEAKKKVLELIPEGAEVFNATSKTLEDLGIPKEINESGRYSSVRNRIHSATTHEDRLAMRRASSAPDYIVGSVQAVTEDGSVVMASNSGSQLAPYDYGAAHVIWVVGAQKVVKDLDAALKRIRERALPYEDARVQRLYGIRSNVSKLLVINKELVPGRIRLIFVKELVGV